MTFAFKGVNHCSLFVRIFETLNSANRYAILFRIQTAKKAETRARRIEQFIGMLERHEKIHP